MNNLRTLRWFGKRGDEGASAVEYGLLVALIAVVVAGAAWALGSALNDQFGKVTDCVSAADGTDDPGCTPGSGGGGSTG